MRSDRPLDSDKGKIMLKNPKIVAIAWAPHQDHVEIDAKRLNANLYFVHYLSYRKPAIAPIKYILQALKTWSILIHERPAVVYILNPPFFAPLTVWLYSIFSHAKIIMATHYSALYGPKWKWSLPITRFLARQALINIADQRRNQQLFESWGAKAIILEKCPGNEYEPMRECVPGRRFRIAVINTFADDDPIEIILEAASLSPDIDWYILGDTQRAPQGLLARASKNVSFTGYLLKEDYWNCLNRANAVMTLTTREYSMMAGAIDSLAIGKPLISSRQPTLEEYFTKGVVFVDNEATGIVQGIREFQRLEKQLLEEIVSLRDEKRTKWEEALTCLQNFITQSL
jgi:glycosyltransferase involved in cell wall biosynthesis